MDVIIIGGGIGGLTLALALHRKGIPCRVFEAAPEVKPLGVGINLLPHAVRELASLGLSERLAACSVETQEVCFYTRHGQLVDQEPRGRFAGYEWPQISIHRADLHRVLLDTVIERLGPDAVTLDHRCVRTEQNGKGITAFFVDHAGQALPPVAGSVAIACDGLHSAVRAQMHPDEPPPIEHVTMSYRGVTRWPAFLTGSSMVYVGTYDTGKLVIYPIRDNVDAEGRQLINWVIEIVKKGDQVQDWGRAASIDDCIGPFEDWTFDWLDIPALIRASDRIIPYPNLDRNPLPYWSVERLTLLGDAAHPMLPRGSNGAAQAILDATALAGLLDDEKDPVVALKRYEAMRLPATANVVLTNRERSPDAILRVVEQRTGGKPFAHIDDVISREEISEWQENYRKVAGFQRNTQDTAR
ncbi:MAG TPA: flavin-dependent oxidoreductase [Alphaproteobacteria bacterium]|jgi:2-polyprenyl-6-methoxyphenol hydroxylase-like FAD-dependent oxidoreductase